jgi:hypothetical protein
MSFKERIHQILQLSEAMKLNILIWGPSPEAYEHFQKRDKIRREIKDRFKNADVEFSENLDEAVPGFKDLTLPEQELIHLAACDVCVVLDTSKGSGEEIAHFVGSAYAHKLIILTHEKYNGIPSFPASLRKYGNQFFYNDEEYEACFLVERVITRIRQVAVARMSGLFS